MTIPPILTLADFEKARKRDPQFFLDAATAAVRSFCGWHVTPVITETVTLDGNGQRSILLPSKRITAVASVLVDGSEVEFDWSATGVLTRAAGAWPTKHRSVVVEYTHGFDAASDVAGIIAGIAQRAAAAGDGALQQRAGSFSVQRGSVGGAAASLPLMETEQRQLEPYRLTWGI